jgi:hypothetical protein
MIIGLQVQVSALIERLSPQDMPVVAAAILDAWCAKTGASHDSIGAFVSHMIEADGDHETRHVLIDMLAHYENGLSMGSVTRAQMLDG